MMWQGGVGQVFIYNYVTMRLFEELGMPRKYRNEWKYCCSTYCLEQLKNRLNGILEHDKHSGDKGVYIVTSLYFDDLRNSCAMAVNAGASKRFKYRLRYYNNDISTLHLELKEKVYGRCHKSSCAISMEQFNIMMNGDIWDLFWDTNDNLLKKFCIDVVTKGFKPKVITEYEREAFVEPNLNIRVTIDRNIFASSDLENFLEGDYQDKQFLQSKGMHVLEVKFDEILPKYIHQLTNMIGIIQTSFSKYYIGLQKVMGN